MDVATITSLISSVGFPIVVSIALGLYINKMNDKMGETITQLVASHKDEVDRLSQALSDNNLILQELKYIIEELRSLGSDAGEEDE